MTNDQQHIHESAVKVIEFVGDLPAEIALNALCTATAWGLGRYCEPKDRQTLVWRILTAANTLGEDYKDDRAAGMVLTLLHPDEDANA